LYWTVGLCVVLAPLSARAATTSLTSTDGIIKVDLKPITPLTSSSFDAGLFGAFPGWTVTKGGAAAGTLTHSGYAPHIVYSSPGKASGGGAIINATYTHPSAPAAGRQFQFTQIASTTGFGASYATPHLDPLVNDDTLPFYWTSAEAAGRTNSTGSQITFFDKPQAPLAGLKTGPVSFTGDLYVTEWDGTKAVTVRDGFRWGYDMTLATHGKSAASFSTPSPACPPATCNGVGTNHIGWGIPFAGSTQSILAFAAANFTPAIDTRFVIGELTFVNGTIESGTGIDSIALAVDLFFGFGTSFGTPKRIDSALSIINTPNGGLDPFADADIVNFTAGGFSGNFHVFEGDSASLPLYAKLTASGDAVAEKQLTDATFGGLELEFAGFGTVSGGGFVTPVPEPSVYTTMIAGLGLIALLSWRRRRRASK
jgi:hypothetical protein